MQSQADLNKWAAQRRDERDAEKAKKFDALKQQKTSVYSKLVSGKPAGDATKPVPMLGRTFYCCDCVSARG